VVSWGGNLGDGNVPGADEYKPATILPLFGSQHTSLYRP
jgi:hypothetical protein